MSVPSYVGSYDQLLNAVLGEPLLGSVLVPYHPLVADPYCGVNSDPSSRLMERIDRPSLWRLSATGDPASVLALQEAVASAGG